MTRRQSQPSSSATIMGKEVRTPWPTSDLAHQIVTLPSCVISRKALGANGLEGVLAVARRGRRKAKTKLALATEDLRKTRRVMFADKRESPAIQTFQLREREQANSLRQSRV